MTAGALLHGPLWGFYLGAIVWWTQVLDYGPLRLILLGTVIEGALLLFEVPTGVVADRISRKWSVVLAFVIMGASVLLAASTNYGLQLVAQGLFGLGYTFVSGADVAWFTDETSLLPDPPDDDELSRLIVRRHRIGMIAGVIGLVPSIFIGMWSTRALLICAGFILLATAVYLALAMSDHHRQGDDSDEHATMREIFQSGFGAVRSVPPIRRLALALVFAGLGAESLDRLGLKEFIDRGDWGDRTLLFTGLLFMIMGIVGAFVVGWVERAVERGASLALMTAGLLAVAAVGAFIAGLAPVAGIAVGLLLQDPCREALDPVTVAWANSEAPAKSRATVLSFVSQAYGAGSVAGGLALGALAEAAGIPTAIVLAGVLFGLGALTAGTTRGQLRHRAGWARSGQ